MRGGDHCFQRLHQNLIDMCPLGLRIRIGIRLIKYGRIGIRFSEYGQIRKKSENPEYTYKTELFLQYLLTNVLIQYLCINYIDFRKKV